MRKQRTQRDLSGREIRGALVIDRASPFPCVSVRWNCRCLACRYRFTKLASSLVSGAVSPACPRCLSPLRAQHGTQGGLKGHACATCGERGHYRTTCGRAKRRDYTYQNNRRAKAREARLAA